MNLNLNNDINDEKSICLIFDEIHKNIKNFVNKDKTKTENSLASIYFKSEKEKKKKTLSTNTFSNLTNLKLRFEINKQKSSNLNNFIDNVVNKDERYLEFIKKTEAIKIRNITCIQIASINFTILNEKIPEKNKKSLQTKLTSKEYNDIVIRRNINSKAKKNKIKLKLITEEQMTFSDDSLDYNIIPFKRNHISEPIIFPAKKTHIPRDPKKIKKEKYDLQTVLAMIKILNIN